LFWFSEAQFEAYRILGWTAMEAIMGRAATYAKLEDLQGAVKSYLDTRGRPMPAPDGDHLVRRDPESAHGPVS